MNNEPTATVFIQKKPTVLRTGPRLFVEQDELAAGIADAYILPIADSRNPEGFRMDITVEAAANESGAGHIATIDIDSIDTNTIRDFAPEGYVRIEAGYLDGETDLPPQPVFYGTLSKISYRLEAGRRRWTISCKAMPDELLQVPCSFTFNGVTIEFAILEVFAVIGITGSINPMARGDFRTLRPSPQGFVPVDFGTVVGPLAPGVNPVNPNNAAILVDQDIRGTVKECLDRLLAILTSNIRVAFGVETNFIWAPDGGGPFIMDLIEQDSQYNPTIDVDVTATGTISAGPESTQIAETLMGDQEEGEVPETVATIEESYSIVTQFDPRIRLGMYVSANDDELGVIPFSVGQYKHTISGKGGNQKWRTEYSGVVPDPDSTTARVLRQ